MRLQGGAEVGNALGAWKDQRRLLLAHEGHTSLPSELGVTGCHAP